MREKEERIRKQQQDDEIKRILACSATDNHGILGLPRGFLPKAEVSAAFRRLCLLLHPDKCQHEGASDAFKRVTSARNAMENLYRSVWR